MVSQSLLPPSPCSLDGGDRAADQNMPRRFGHVEGARRAREAVEACRELGVEVNPSRPPASSFPRCIVHDVAVVVKVEVVLVVLVVVF